MSPLSKPSAKISAGRVFWMLVPEVSVPLEPSLAHTITKSPPVRSATEGKFWAPVV